jgi:hypothetical protein
MMLPHAESAIVEQEKVTEYLLNPTHPDNGGKAAFFLSLGFRREDWPRLASAFRRLAESVELRSSVDSLHGQKYIVDGPIETPGGKTPLVRTVWIVDAGQDTPRLVTAYPHE